MTVNALALFVRTAMYRQPGKIDDNTPSAQDFRIGTLRAGVGMHRPSPDELDIVENDYYRFLHAPRD